ncbi:FAD/NAD(P)-binding domain-containing protein [Ganoderma leucocontextum]|nr:FAD/NAD(P)-binding domain-containing protein [Ganoderma leucocontextum]
MSLPHFAQVLIVGAGPTGITLALALHKQGCLDIVVVDGSLYGQNTSRAAVIHAATVEALETIGVADTLVQQGLKFKKTLIWSGTQKLETASFEPLSKYTKYNYILGIPQHVTENILNQAAEDRGISVFRPFKVVSIKPSADDSKLTDVFFDNGRVLRARLVVGADGARSTIRQLANVGWADPSGEVNVNKKDDHLANMIVADITVTNPPSFPPETFNVALFPDNVVLWVPLPGEPYTEMNVPKGDAVYRMAAGIPQERGHPPPTPDTAYLQELLDTWGPHKVLPAGTPQMKISRTLWSSRFRTHSAVADSFFAHVPSEGGAEGGPILLLGDAGHIHPPVGGQGMNLGIRDAIQLAPVLAEFIRAAASEPSTAELEKPLAEWAAERRSKALTVISLVKRMQGLISMPNERQYALGFIPYNAAWIRDTLAGFATKFEVVQAKGAYQVSGLGNP